MVGVIHTQIRQIKWTNCLSGLYGCRENTCCKSQNKIYNNYNVSVQNYNMIEMMTNRSVKTNQPTNQTNKKT